MGTVDRAIEKTMAVIGRVLALAFVFAVGLNFVNVIDRYLLGHSMMGADEVQIYIMVYMTFLGAVVVTSRKAHLRMDVLVQHFPRWFQSVIKVAEFVLFIALACFVLVQSSRYTWQMFTLGRKSDNMSIPMWIPHGVVALGFGLMALIVLWHGIQFVRGEKPGDSGSPTGAEGTNS